MMDRNDTNVAERPRGTIKHPAVAIALASGRVLYFALRHGPKPLMVDYKTGDVWLYNGSEDK